MTAETTDRLDSHLTRVRDDHRDLLRDEDYTLVARGRARRLEEAWRALEIPWSRAEAPSGSSGWTLETDCGQLSVVYDPEGSPAVVVEAEVVAPGLEVQHARFLRALLELNWSYGGWLGGPRFLIDPQRGVGIARVRTQSYNLNMGSTEAIAGLLVDVLDALSDVPRPAPSNDPVSGDVQPAEADEDDASEDEEGEDDRELDDLLVRARKEHRELLDAAEAAPLPKDETASGFEAALRALEVPYEVDSSDVGDQSRSYALYTDAGAIRGVANEASAQIILSAETDNPSGMDAERLLRLNSFAALSAGVCVAISDGDNVCVRAFLGGHDITCTLPRLGQLWLQRSIEMLIRTFDRAAAAHAPTCEDPNTPDDQIETLEELTAQLNGLTGLQPVKAKVRSVTNMLRVQQRRKERGLAVVPMSQHLVFTGPPGTGKTTVARLVGKIYRAVGLLEKGHVVVAARQDLVGGYIGQTAIKTNKVINRAIGGVLFIDEAYTLSPPDADRDFGREAVDTLLARMENDRDNLVVIVAGYPAEMRRFLHANPGLESRFPRVIEFPDYTPEELSEILDHFAMTYGYALTPEARETAAVLIREAWVDRTERFGNARMVRNLIEHALHRHADRLLVDETLDNDSDEALATLEAADFERLPDRPQVGGARVNR